MKERMKYSFDFFLFFIDSFRSTSLWYSISLSRGVTRNSQTISLLLVVVVFGGLVFSSMLFSNDRRCRCEGYFTVTITHVKNQRNKRHEEYMKWQHELIIITTTVRIIIIIVLLFKTTNQRIIPLSLSLLFYSLSLLFYSLPLLFYSLTLLFYSL